MRALLFVLLGISIIGCSTLIPVQADRDAQREFVYDYEVQGVDKTELWVRARNFIAESFGDSRSVLRVEDREETTLIGRGAVSWNLLGNTCATEYQLRFESRDNRARLGLEIIEGVPPYSACTGWPWPSEDGYNTIINSFERLSNGLEDALNESSSFSDF